MARLPGLNCLRAGILAFLCGASILVNLGSFLPAATNNVKRVDVPAETQTQTPAETHRKILANGEGYEIFQVLPGDSSMQNFVLGPHTQIIHRLHERLVWLDTITDIPDQNQSCLDRARFAYTEMVKSVVTGVVYLQAEPQVIPTLSRPRMSVKEFNLEKRKVGLDWTYLGDTMTGWMRIDNVRKLLIDVMTNGVPGDFIETGVWRGGMSIFARSVIHAYNQSHRKSYVCDSFRGLPPGNSNLHRGDAGWDNTPYLEVDSNIVVNSFAKYSLLDSNVVFVKGFFNDTMEPLSNITDKFAIMRLDGDMYQSTVDVLYNFYDKLSIGGYLIMDDWYGFPSKDACEDFFNVHGFHPEIIQIDNLAAYWKKTEEVKIEYWRYEKGEFGGSHGGRPRRRRKRPRY